MLRDIHHLHLSFEFRGIALKFRVFFLLTNEADLHVGEVLLQLLDRVVKFIDFEVVPAVVLFDDPRGLF